MAWKGGDKSAGGKRSGVAAGFVGLGDYLANSKERGGPDHRIFAFGSNFDAADIHHAMREMDCVASQNARLKKPVFHWGFSLPKDKDTGQPLEQLSPEQWEALAYHSIRELGLEHHQVAWVLHEDAGHQHIHLVANRQSLEGGPAWRPSHDHYQMRATARWAELEFHLSRHLEPNRTAAHRRTDREFRAVRTEGNATFWSDALPEFRDAISWHDLAGRLAPKGLSVEPARDHEGGLILRHSSGPAKALSSVHPSLTGPKLASRFGETHRDFLGRNLSVPEPTAAERRPLDVDTLINEISAHRALWTEADARRAARPFPDGSDVLQELWTSDRLLEVRPGLYTTRETVAMEDATFALAEKMRNRGHAVDLATGESLAGEHLEVVRAALGDEGLFILQGPPGSGKTTAARALVDSYRSAGYDVYGAAVTGKAAEGLREAADIDARTLAAWRRDWKYKPDSGGKPSVMIVDEASMLSLQDMRPLLEHADEWNMKLILIGDVDQLPPVGAGDPYRRMLEEFSSARLTEIHRQQVEWMRDASNALVRGEVWEALAAYEERGHLHWTETAEDARSALVMQYFEDRSAAPDQSSLLVAYRNADVRALNEEIRELRRERGELQDGERIHSKEFAPGDRVLFRRNERRCVHGENGQSVPVQNGTLGTVTEIERDRVSVRLDSGVDVRFDPAEYSDLDHGYAVSLYKSQGVTVDRAYVLADGHVDAHGFMVAATRHRRHLEIHVPQEEFGDLDAVERVFSRRARADLVRDYTDRPLGRPVEPGLEPGPTRRSEEPAAVDFEVLDRQSRRLMIDLRKASRELPDAEELGRLHGRIDRLEERSAPLRDPGRDFFVERLRSLADRVSHQYHASKALAAASEGLSADHERAYAAYRALPEPRYIPEPPKPAEPSRSPESDHLGDRLAARVDRFRREHRRYLEVLAPHRGDTATSPVVEHWKDRFEVLDGRLQRLEFLTAEHREAKEEMDQIPKTGERLPDLARKASEIARTEARIEALTRLEPSSRDLVEHLRRAVEGARTDRDTSPLAEMIRAHRMLKERETLESENSAKFGVYRRMLSEEALNGRIDAGDRAFDWNLRQDLGQIYLRPGRAYERFRHLEGQMQPEGLLDTLRKDPNVLGTYKLAFPSRLRSRVSDLVELYADHQADRDELVEQKTERAALVEELDRLRSRLIDIPDRDNLLATVYTSHRDLSREERAALPEDVHRLAEALHTTAERHSEKTREVLRDLGRLADRVGREAIRRAALRASPAPVRKLYTLARSLRALQKSGPKYLLKASVRSVMPPHIAVAIQIARAARAVVRVLTHDRSQGIGY